MTQQEELLALDDFTRWAITQLGPCRYDHDDCCQEHFLDERPCPVDDIVEKLRVCWDCERCTWNPGGDCGKADHARCERCGHCEGRHSA